MDSPLFGPAKTSDWAVLAVSGICSPALVGMCSSDFDQAFGRKREGSHWVVIIPAAGLACDTFAQTHRHECLVALQHV